MTTIGHASLSARQPCVFRRSAVFVYSVVSYGLFLATFLYAIGFLGNFGVPRTLDSTPTTPWTTALLIDSGLLALFAVQHSVMARKPFKRFITRFIPVAAERSTYVLASSAALAFLFWQWQPLGGTVWQVTTPAGRTLLHLGFAFGWALVLVSTFAISHFDLFGLRQAWREMRGRSQASLQFTVPLLYRIVRHPLYVGWFFAFWSTPDMTATHLLFSLATTAYILIAIRLEEKDLMKDHPEYAEYRRKVPMLLPRLASAVSLERGGQSRKPEVSSTARAVSGK